MRDRDGKKKTRATGEQGESGELPDPLSEEFVYLVATLAWRNGLTANSISKELFKDSSPRHLMQVKRALRRAYGTILILKPPLAVDVARRLADAVNAKRKRPINIHVVDDRYIFSGTPVHVKAAEVIADFISEIAVQEKLLTDAVSDEDHIVICNAGGRTVAETVKALARNPPVRDDSDEDSRRLSKMLLFVAANAAYQPEEFHRSANFLSVTMAELFDSKHLALPKQEDPELAKRHKGLVMRAALFICGAGACHASDESGLMSTYFKNNNWAVPAQAVGDLAFNLLDKHGDEVELDPEPLEFIRRLNPSVSLSTLAHITNDNRVLLILDAKNPATKVGIGLAALSRYYATDVVLGAKLATLMLEALDQPSKFASVAAGQ